ncbi:MAG: prephenate dehydratase domain-containing protein [Vagococcus sp.]
MKVGYLGPKGSFTHAATLSFFKKNNLIALPTIISALKKIETKSVDYGKLH